MTLTTDDDLRREAVRRANAKLGFRSHLFAYLVVNAGLFALNVITSPNYLWCLWSMFGWGIGLAAHGFAVYGAGDDLRDRMVERELERLRTRRPTYAPAEPPSPNP